MAAATAAAAVVATTRAKAAKATAATAAAATTRAKAAAATLGRRNAGLTAQLTAATAAMANAQAAATTAAMNAAAAIAAAKAAAAKAAADRQAMGAPTSSYKPKQKADVYISKGDKTINYGSGAPLRVIVADSEQSLDAAIAAAGGTGETYAICADGPGDTTDLLSAAGVILNIELPARYKSPGGDKFDGVNGRLYRVVHLDATNFYKQFMSYVRPTHYADSIWAELRQQ